MSKDGINNGFYGKHHSEETKKRMSIASKGRKMSKETKEKISLAQIGKVLSVKTRKKISNKLIEYNKNNKSHLLGKHLSEQTKNKLSNSLKGHIVSEETKQKIREGKIGSKNPMFGKHLSEEHRMKIGLSKIGKKISEETRKKISKSCHENAKINPNYSMRGKHLTQEQLQKCLKGLYNRPTSFEKRISELCIENNLPFIYTGDGRFLINFKNPDFIDENNKIAIEVFYSWFKIRDYGSVEKYKEFCTKKYNSAGWRVIFIDENEVNIDNWKEVCLNKIMEVKNG